MRDELTLTQILERYAAIRDTIQGLKFEQDELGKQIKEALQHGAQIESELYQAKLRISVRRSYPMANFRATFGDSAALEAANIDSKKAEALAQAGDLDSEQLKQLAQIKEIHSLILQPKPLE